jgi:hypothetical protein
MSLNGCCNAALVKYVFKIQIKSVGLKDGYILYYESFLRELTKFDFNFIKYGV